jgi:hypothetical protein
VTVNGFQDRRIRPLCHLSGAKVSVPDKTTKLISLLIKKTLKNNKMADS